MYILAQNKKTIVEFSRIEVSSNLTMKKEEKYVLIAHYNTSANSVSSSTIIGSYPSEEAALKELRSIFTALSAEQPVYEVR
ncbi:MAG: hypothetical protein UHY68_07895 [Acutalibacteraceae bacterium]|nr:hypothetical protein [Acutalibacteraceae bacterium]